MQQQQMLWIALSCALAAGACALGVGLSDWFLLAGALSSASLAAWLLTEPPP